MRSSNSSSRTISLNCIALAILAAQPGLAWTADGEFDLVADSGPDATPANSLDEIAVELINPVGSLFSISNEIEYTTFQGELNGASDHPRGDFLIKPSFPFLLKNGKSIVVRATIPINFSEPTYPFQGVDYADWRIRQFADIIPNDRTFRTDHSFMDDISVDVAYGGVNEKGYITIFGAAAVLAVSQDGSSERDQYLLGPQFAFGKVTRWGVIGAWVSHLTDVLVADKKFPEYETNLTSLKIFFAYGLGNGWQIISNPVIEYDWEGLKDNKLLLPIGGGISKTTSIGSMPLKISLELYNYIESPAAYGPDWLLRVGITPVLSDRSRR